MELEDFHIESFEVLMTGTDNVVYCIEIEVSLLLPYRPWRDHSYRCQIHSQSQLSDS